MAKRRKTVRRKTAKRGKAGGDDWVVTIVVLVAIALVLIAGYLYQQNRKQAGLVPSPSIVALAPG